ncbi:MAG TPA: Na-translocating system protein MpsC family protein [Solirubrobacteraceae bacterium]|jgi:uncharacterized protein YbcI
MSSTTASTATVAISNGVARVHKARLGRGPELVRTTIDGNLVVCVLRGGLTIAERTLADAGRQDLVTERRAALDEVLQAELSAVVSEALHRPVRSAMSAIDQRMDLHTLIFVLGGETGTQTGTTGPGRDAAGTESGTETAALSP